MEGTKVSYSFRANNTSALFRLLVFCVLEFLLFVIVFFWWLFVFWRDGTFSLLLGLSLPIVLPIATFYFFRKTSTEEITVVLSATKMEIQWPLKKMEISFADIKSYSACCTSQDTYDRESVRIRLKNGKKLRLSATSDLCDIKPLKDFRETFDNLAQKLKLQQKYNWEERLLMKK
jgi:hypothetical protein